MKHKPEVYPHQSRSRYDDKLAEEGYEVQQNVTDFLFKENGGRKYVFNEKFKTADGLFAEADIISRLRHYHWKMKSEKTEMIMKYFQFSLLHCRLTDSAS